MRLILSKWSGLCINEKRNPCSLLASVSNIVCVFVLNGFTTSGDVSSFFVRMKSASCGSCQVNTIFVLVIFLRFAAQCASSGIKLTSWLASPRNARSSVSFVGRLNSLMAFNMFLSGNMRCLLMVCPAKLMVSPICSFAFEMVRFMSWHHVEVLKKRPVI